MFNGMMMDPEMIRIAQEQMSRISPQEFARIQQQMFSNPELMKMASESMKNMRPEDIKAAAEQLKHTRPEDMVEISEKMANASPEDIAAMRSRADAHASYEYNGAQMLKQQGNEFHSQGRFREAVKKYLHAKNNVKDIPGAKFRTLQTQCSLNLMSCYLKTRQFQECIEEGSQVLASDFTNVKALYRRGQAFKELGNLEAAVSDLRKAQESSPDDETIMEAFRDASERLGVEGTDQTKPKGLIIEEIVEDEQPTTSVAERSAPVEHTITPPKGEYHSDTGGASNSGRAAAESEFLRDLKDNPEAVRSFQDYISNATPESLAALGANGMSSEMVKTATDVISKMKPDELQKMIQLSSSFNPKHPGFSEGATNDQANKSRLGSQFPDMSPEMISMATEKISKMSPEELQKMVEIASSLKLNDPSISNAASSSQSRDKSGIRSSSLGSSSTENPQRGKGTASSLVSDSTVGSASSVLPTPSADLQENMRNSMKDPAMRQMFASMMKSMSPEMMADMSQQFGVNLSKEDAAKAQQTFSSLSPDDLDRMLRWADQLQTGVQTAKKAKNWLLGRPGMILAIAMLILAALLHWLGFIGS